jgi:hypothetical protein
MKMSSNFGGPIISAISSEATLWYVTLSNPINEAFASKWIRLTSEFSIDYASRLINSATAVLGSSFAPKKSFMPVYV